MEDSVNLELFAPEEVGGISLEEVFEAYFDCRKRKRGTCNALAFEVNYERECIDLWRDINAGTYRPSRSIAFVVTKPVKREVFAADFRDRVVHHLIARRVEPLFEQRFIDDSYSTRKGKGTLYGINRVEGFICECSRDYTEDCYVMKIDIRSFFMNIPKQPLYDKLSRFLCERYTGDDLPMLLYLIRETIFNRPEKHCVRRSPRSLWKGLPPEKSLFASDGTHGLPIGNLTSQLMALFYLDELDHLVTERWGIGYYGRYVDDMLFVHPSKERLLAVRLKVEEWLSRNGLSLHPRKMYLQHYTKGVLFIGGMLLPGRKYISRRTVSFCLEALGRMNAAADTDFGYTLSDGAHFIQVLNSYLGMMRHFHTYNRRKIIMAHIGEAWWRVAYVEGSVRKAVLKREYRPFYYYLKKYNDDREGDLGGAG